MGQVGFKFFPKLEPDLNRFGFFLLNPYPTLFLIGLGKIQAIRVGLGLPSLSGLIQCFSQYCPHAKKKKKPRSAALAGKKKIYIYICIYDKWNYHLEKAKPAPFLYCYYYYYYYICLFGWLRRKGEVSRSDISDYIYMYIFIYLYISTHEYNNG